jgi:outer membrane protein assembly factor BamB
VESRAGGRVAIAVVVVALGAASCSSGSGSSASKSTSTTRAPSSTISTPPTTTAGATTTTGAAGGAAPWPTYYGDAARTGLSAGGPATPANVHQQWASPTLDGAVYAQPLVAEGHVIVATENDTVYSLDESTGKIVWQSHLGTPVPGSSLPCGDVDPVGITGTPVVDVSASRVYAVGMVQPGKDVLFDLDLGSGKLIDSTGVDAPGADPKVHNQRSALALASGKVYVAYGGRFGDCGDYHGRVVSVAVSASGLGAVASYTLPTEGQGGFWAPPGPAVASDGSLYLASGNSSSESRFDYGNAVVRLSPDLQLLDYWAPSDWLELNASDGDLGSTSPVLLPDDRVFQVGKDGIGYLLNATDLGGIGGDLAHVEACSSLAYGGVPHDGDTMYVSCPSELVQVVASGSGLRLGWATSVAGPGPSIIANGAVWAVSTTRGDLVALDVSTGAQLFSTHVGTVPSRFTSLAAADGRVFVPANSTLFAFAD